MIEIIEYEQEHQPQFERLNREWIEKYFHMEEVDLFVLQHPEQAILAEGGAILMARCNEEVAGTVALRKMSDEVYEFTKMAVDPAFRRRGIAEQLSRAAFEKARAIGASKVILYSNTILEGAILMYRKLGFREVPIEDSMYKRSDIKMEIQLNSIFKQANQ
jgi:ribosomal protein S18 acetylase RimI-like enzyme